MTAYPHFPILLKPSHMAAIDSMGNRVHYIMGCNTSICMGDLSQGAIERHWRIGYLSALLFKGSYMSRGVWSANLRPSVEICLWRQVSEEQRVFKSMFPHNAWDLLIIQTRRVQAHDSHSLINIVHRKLHPYKRQRIYWSL